VSGYEEIGVRSLQDLADFACCVPDDVEPALIELGRILRIERDGERIRAAFPTRADEQKRRERSQREAADAVPRDDAARPVSARAGQIAISDTDKTTSDEFDGRASRLEASRCSFH
jgi:hypothetical protein